MKKPSIITFLIIFASFPWHSAANNPNPTIKRVAIFVPGTHQGYEEIERGFKEKLGLKPFGIVTFNANGNQAILRMQAQEIVNGTYDAIFTIGTGCTLAIAQLFQERKESNVYHVFVGFDGCELIQSIQREMENTCMGNPNAGKMTQEELNAYLIAKNMFTHFNSDYSSYIGCNEIFKPLLKLDNLFSSYTIHPDAIISEH